MNKCVTLSVVRGAITVALVLPLSFVANRVGAQNASPQSAKAIQGTWEVGGQPRGPWIFSFQVDGNALTGRMWQDGGKIGPVDIIDGRVAGDSVSFRYEIPKQGPGNPRATFTLTGVQRKDQIVFSSTSDLVNPPGSKLRTMRSARGELFGVSEKFSAKPSVAAVAGRVTVEEGLPCPEFRLVFTHANGRRFDAIKYAITSSLGIGITRTNVVKPDPKPTLRRFLLRLPPGDYRPVISDLPKGYALRAIRLGAVDITDGVLHVIAEGPAAELTVALFPAPSSPWTMVQGRVLNAATRKGHQGGMRLGGAVDPTPTSVELMNGAISEPWTAVIGPNGTFEFPRISPGTYQLRALPESAATPSVRVVIPASGVFQLNVTVPDIVPVTCPSC